MKNFRREVVGIFWLIFKYFYSRIVFMRVFDDGLNFDEGCGVFRLILVFCCCFFSLFEVILGLVYFFKM